MGETSENNPYNAPEIDEPRSSRGDRLERFEHVSDEEVRALYKRSVNLAAFVDYWCS